MSPLSGSPAPATERRLAMLQSHLHPSASQLVGGPGPARASSERRQLMAAAEAALNASPSARGRKGDSLGDCYCVFCEIVKGTLPSFKLYEDDMCLCILDVKPLSLGTAYEIYRGKFDMIGVRIGFVNRGDLAKIILNIVAMVIQLRHSLVIPKSHFPSLQATPPSVLGAICSKLPLLGKALIRATQCDAFNVLVNNGEEAGQVIFHTHVHIIPRSKDDGLWSSETYQRNSLKDNQGTDNLVSCIKELLSSPEDYSTEESTILPK